MSFFVSNSLKNKFSFEDLLKDENDKSIYAENKIEFESYPILLVYLDDDKNKLELEIVSLDVEKSSFVLRLDKNDYKEFISNVEKENASDITIFNNHVKSLSIALKNIKNYKYVSDNLIDAYIVIE